MSTIKVQNIQHTSSSTNAIALASNGTCTANITNNLSHRNLIKNGAMQIFQRGNTFTMSATNNQVYTVDQFQHNVTSGASFASTDSVSADHPDGFTKSLKITPTATNTPTGSGNAGYRQKIEGGDLQHLAFGTSSAKTITLSFYAKSGSQNNGHQYGIQLRTFATSGASSDRRTVTAPFTVTSSWQRFTFTFAGNTDKDIINDTTNGLEVNWHFAAGPDDIISAYTTWTADTAFKTVTGQSNFLDNTNNEFYLTGVQLEVGSYATDYEFISVGEDLARCQRYYFQGNYGAATGNAFYGMRYGTSNSICPVHLPVTMRERPTVESLTPAGGGTLSAIYENNNVVYYYVADDTATNVSKGDVKISAEL